MNPVARRKGTIDQLEEWMTGNGLKWESSAIKFVSADVLDSAGIAVSAITDVSEGTHLCTIPKSAILSVRNTGIADVLELERLGGGLGLISAVMFERSRGSASPWCA
jgi:hypothetical protein